MSRSTAVSLEKSVVILLTTRNTLTGVFFSCPMFANTVIVLSVMSTWQYTRPYAEVTAWICTTVSRLDVPEDKRMSPTRAATSITAATCPGSVRSTGASGDGGGAALIASIVAMRPARWLRPRSVSLRLIPIAFAFRRLRPDHP